MLPTILYVYFSLGFIPVYPNWNFVAFTWDSSGNLHSNINGKHNHTSSNFKQDYYLDMNDGGGMWTVGGMQVILCCH